MTQQNDEPDIIKALRERAKELNCIYRVEELLQDYEADPQKVFQNLVSVIPAGYSYPEICEARFTYKGVPYQTPGFVENHWVMSAQVHAKRVAELVLVGLERGSLLRDRDPGEKHDGQRCDPLR